MKSLDPVFDALMERDSFRLLLHERPLYLTGRSLLLEEHALYSEAMKLYAARNAIVHGRDTPTVDDLGQDVHGGRRALRCAIGLFSWLGQQRSYVIPGMETGRYSRGVMTGADASGE